ncbi:Cytochrome p450 [Neofusicoccum parvum]|nr:Cytochrome p450 [Neofusicoccum parvum]
MGILIIIFSWKDIYGHKTASKQGHVQKDPSFYQPDYNGRTSMLTKIDDHEHSRARKVFTNAFSDRALKAQEPLIHNHVDKFISIIRQKSTEKPGQPIDAVKLLNCLTFDIIGDLAFGESLGLLETAEYNDWLRTVFGTVRTLATMTFLFEYPILGAIASLFVPKSLKESRKMMFEFSSTRVEKRMEKGAVTEKPDFWSLALAQHDKGAIDIEDMKANAGLFMIAGSETTATFLSGFLYNMLMNPSKMEKLVAEVRGSFRSEDELTIENVRALKYLAACFDESLRVYPPVPQGPSRIMDTEGGVVSGHFVPKNYTAYHSPANFKDPLSFVPERWIADDPAAAEFEGDRKAVLQPFSYGPRNCIGKNLALHEMRLTATKLLWNFDIELCPESKGTWHEQKMFWILWEKPPLWLKFKAAKRDT